MKFYLFDRKDKIIHFKDLSILQNKNPIEKSCDVTMSQNEVFVIQIAALSDSDTVINDIVFNSSGLNLQCINTDVVDKFGVYKKQPVKLKGGVIQPLFFVAEAEKTGARCEKATACVKTDSGEFAFDINFKINESLVANNGYNDLFRLSRLKWLNSTLMQNDDVVKPFVSPTLNKNVVSILGRDIEFSENGLPKQVFSHFDESVQICGDTQKTLFTKPVEFNIDGVSLCAGKTEYNTYKNRVESVTLGDCENYNSIVTCKARYDGMLEYSVSIIPKKDFTVKNTSLDLFVDKDCASLMHGLGHRASAAENLHFKWDVDKQQDCIFIGAVNSGVRVKFKAENYARPLINIFYKNLPLNIPKTTWDNFAKGAIDVTVLPESVHICASTGVFEFKKGEKRHFDFEFHFTPFKPFDYKKAFSVRYSHTNSLKNEYKEIDEAAENGLNYVIFHQGNCIMPYINYPFYETDRLKKAVQYAEHKGIGVKLYYTEREHSNHMAETFVYKALGDEIILRKQGVSHSWQKEKPQWLVDNFGEDIIPGWFVKYKHGKYKGEHDFSFIVRPDTRLDNYYIEGLKWLVDNIGIKGIYIDDTSLDRTTIERAKKLLDGVDGLIDMHMWNHEETRAGDVSCLNLYAELLPFLDSIWLGEGFFYKKYSPEYMLAEVSGIPYGVPGQMLQDGGDLYAGMLYAMNNRFGWGCKNAVDMYKIWDEFEIQKSKMLGYWHSENPIKTDNSNVLTTVYLKDDSALLCVYNFSDYTEKFNFVIDNRKLGFSISKCSEIKFGKNRKTKKDLSADFALRKRKGIILLLEK